jgi:DNA polymerase I-like protein with 3'-5' exonuclease and polymerase domains
MAKRSKTIAKPIATPDVRQAESLMSTWAMQLITDMTPSLSATEAAILNQQVSVLERPTTSEAAPDKIDPTQPSIIRARRDLDALAAEVAAAADVVINLETSALVPDKGVIVGIGLSLEKTTYYIPAHHRFDDRRQQRRPNQLALVEVLDAIRLSEKALIAHNAKKTMHLLQGHCDMADQFVWDTLIAARLLRSDLPAEDLEQLAVRELDVAPWHLPRGEMNRVEVLPIETVAACCAKDCLYTRLLCAKQRGVIR